jgi:hypothetical protein
VVRGDWWPTISDHATVWATSTVAATALATALSVHCDDLAARRRLATIVERLAGIEPGKGELVDGAAALIDLGLGDDRRVERVVGRSAYRHPTQVMAEVVGDPESAASALERVEQRSRAAVTLAALVLGANLVFLALALPTALRGVRLIP